MKMYEDVLAGTHVMMFYKAWVDWHFSSVLPRKFACRQTQEDILWSSTEPIFHPRGGRMINKNSNFAEKLNHVKIDYEFILYPLKSKHLF